MVLGWAWVLSGLSAGLFPEHQRCLAPPWWLDGDGDGHLHALALWCCGVVLIFDIRAVIKVFKISQFSRRLY